MIRAMPFLNRMLGASTTRASIYAEQILETPTSWGLTSQVQISPRQISAGRTSPQRTLPAPMCLGLQNGFRATRVSTPSVRCFPEPPFRGPISSEQTLPQPSSSNQTSPERTLLKQTCKPHRRKPHRRKPHRRKPHRRKPHRLDVEVDQPHACEPSVCSVARLPSAESGPKQRQPSRCGPRGGESYRLEFDLRKSPRCRPFGCRPPRLQPIFLES